MANVSTATLIIAIGNDSLPEISLSEIASGGVPTMWKKEHVIIPASTSLFILDQGKITDINMLWLRARKTSDGLAKSILVELTKTGGTAQTVDACTDLLISNSQVTNEGFGLVRVTTQATDEMAIEYAMAGV